MEPFSSDVSESLSTTFDDTEAVLRESELHIEREPTALLGAHYERLECEVTLRQSVLGIQEEPLLGAVSFYHLRYACVHACFRSFPR